MPTISFEGSRYTSHSGETILETLLRHGDLIPSKCKNGHCRSCMVRVIEGVPPVDGQKKLRDTMAVQGFILPCSCTAEWDLTLAHKDLANYETTLTVTEKQPLGAAAVCLRLTAPEPFPYRSGQYVHLIRPSDGRECHYNLASSPDENAFLEIHVARSADDEMSRWLCDQVQVGDRIDGYGPAGGCFYLPEDRPRPILLVGIGTGLATVYGILKDATKHRHPAPIHLIHAAREGGHYLDDALNTLAADLPQVSYTPCGSEPDDINRALASRQPKLDGWKAYLCGDSKGIKATQKTIFLSGIAMADIYSVMY